MRSSLADYKTWDAHRPSCPKSGLRIRERMKTECWVCDVRARRKYVHWMPYLDELYDWLDNGGISDDCRDMLYDYFYESMPYGYQTGDTGDIDEWLCDRPEEIKDLIGNIEWACVSEKPLDAEDERAIEVAIENGWPEKEAE